MFKLRAFIIKEREEAASASRWPCSRIAAFNRIFLLILSIFPAVGMSQQLPPLDVSASLVANLTVKLTWQVAPIGAQIRRRFTGDARKASPFNGCESQLNGNESRQSFWPSRRRSL
jgi:hypothetical protein